jgi:phasin family protein
LGGANRFQWPDDEPNTEETIEMTTLKTVKNTSLSAADSVKPVEEAVAVQQDAAEALAKVGADATGKTVDKAVAMSKEHVDTAIKAGAEVFKGFEDLVQFNKDNLEALVSSAAIVARGVQDLSKTVVALAQESLEESVATGKALVGAKSLKEVIDLSSTMAKSNFDKLVAESTKLSQLSSKLAEDAIAPINSRVEAAVQKLSKTAA